MTELVSTRCVLAVRELRRSTAYFIDALGFSRDFDSGDKGLEFLSRDGFQVMLGECPDERAAGELGNHSWFAYITVRDVDALFAELGGRGATIMSEPQSEPWGMREFGVRTPDGHRITFGEPTGAG